MFCPNCGGQNPSNAANCASCGHALAPQAQPPQPPPGYYPQRQPESVFMSFKTLIAPSEVRTVYLIGVAAIILRTLFAFFNALLTVFSIGGTTTVNVTFHNVMGSFMVLMSGVVAILVLRLICELIVILSKKKS